MPLGDVTEQMRVLDSMFGVDHSSAMASSHTVHIYTGNPYDGGVEITGPGYAAVSVDNDATWPAADTDATKSIDVTFPDPTDAWDDGGCWVLTADDTDDIAAWEFFDAPLEVDGAGDGPVVTVTVYVPNDDNVAA